MALSMDDCTADCTSRLVGQMSLRNTDRPSASSPIGSLYGSQSIRPASAKATTSGGDIRKLARTSELIRPSKLRFPESTEQATSPPLAMASEICCGSGPELPMQVVQP